MVLLSVICTGTQPRNCFQETAQHVQYGSALKSAKAKSHNLVYCDGSWEQKWKLSYLWSALSLKKKSYKKRTDPDRWGSQINSYAVNASSFAALHLTVSTDTLVPSNGKYHTYVNLTPWNFPNLLGPMALQKPPKIRIIGHSKLPGFLWYWQKAAYVTSSILRWSSPERKERCSLWYMRHFLYSRQTHSRRRFQYFPSSTTACGGNNRMLICSIFQV